MPYIVTVYCKDLIDRRESNHDDSISRTYALYIVLYVMDICKIHLGTTAMDYEELNYSVVDSFTNKIFCGNPAAVVEIPPNISLTPEILQLIAREFNLSETAFIAKLENKPSAFQLRWFTPKEEVPLCGHATLASAHILFTSGALSLNVDVVNFETMSGTLTARKLKENMYELDFPAGETTEVDEELKIKVKAVVEKAVMERFNIIYVGVGSGVSFSSYMLIELESSLDLANMSIDPSHFVSYTCHTALPQ